MIGKLKVRLSESLINVPENTIAIKSIYNLFELKYLDFLYICVGAVGRAGLATSAQSKKKPIDASDITAVAIQSTASIERGGGVTLP